MREYFARLSSMERRFVFGAMLLVFVVLNAWLVWPHFSDWKKYNENREKARTTLDKFEKAIANSAGLEAKVIEMEGEGERVPTEEQTIKFVGDIQSQAAQSGVTISANTRVPDRTNSLFFIERAQNLTIQSGESQLVDFLYNLGAGKSLIRVRSLSLHPDPPHHALNGNVTLVASYQKKPATPAVAAPAPAPATPTNKPASSVPAPPKPATPTKK